MIIPRLQIVMTWPLIVFRCQIHLPIMSKNNEKTLIYRCLKFLQRGRILSPQNSHKILIDSHINN